MPLKSSKNEDWRGISKKTRKQAKINNNTFKNQWHGA
jgi:endo-beta-N-acetylglucosaminidase D